MTDGVKADLAALKAARQYPQFGPEDDDFHDEVSLRSLVGDRDLLVLLECARTADGWVDLLPGQAQREPVQRGRVGLG